MCEKKSIGHLQNRIDPCIRNLIHALNKSPEMETLASCCGHGIYPLTVVMRAKTTGVISELLSGKILPRSRRFYKRDSNGYYYIPEVSSPSN